MNEYEKFEMFVKQSPKLNILKFKLDCVCETENNDNFQRFKKFENDLSYVKKRSYKMCLFEI